MFTPECVFYADIICSAAAVKSLVFIILVFDIPSVKWIEKNGLRSLQKAVSQNIYIIPIYNIYYNAHAQRRRHTECIQSDSSFIIFLFHHAFIQILDF